MKVFLSLAMYRIHHSQENQRQPRIFQLKTAIALWYLRLNVARPVLSDIARSCGRLKNDVHQVPLLHDNLHLELPRLLMPSLQVQPVVEEVMLAWMESVEAEA